MGWALRLSPKEGLKKKEDGKANGFIYIYIYLSAFFLIDWRRGRALSF